MDLPTCTAAVVTPYPKHVSQAQLRADSRPQSSRRPSPHPPQPPFLAQSCLSRAFPAVRCPSPRKLSSNAHEHSHNAHEHTPMSAIPHHSPSPESHALQFTQSHPNSHQTLTNAHTTLMQTHPCRPAPITARHPNHANCSADNLTQTLVKRSQTLTNTRKHSHRRPTALPAVPRPSSALPPPLWRANRINHRRMKLSRRCSHWRNKTNLPMRPPTSNRR